MAYNKRMDANKEKDSRDLFSQHFTTLSSLGDIVIGIHLNLPLTSLYLPTFTVCQLSNNVKTLWP